MLQGIGPDMRPTSASVRVAAGTPSLNLEIMDLVFPNGPDTRPAMDEDECVLCILVYVYVVYHGEVVSERGGGATFRPV